MQADLNHGSRPDPVQETARIFELIASSFAEHRKLVAGGNDELVKASALKEVPEFDANKFQEFVQYMGKLSGIDLRNGNEDWRWERMSVLALTEPLTVGVVWEAFKPAPGSTSNPQVMSGPGANGRLESYIEKFFQYRAALELNDAGGAKQLGDEIVRLSPIDMSNFRRGILKGLNLDAEREKKDRIDQWLSKDEGKRSIAQISKMIQQQFPKAK